MSVSLSECEDNLYLPSFDAKKMKGLLNREHYNPNLLDQFSCILKNITTPGENGNNIRLLRYLSLEKVTSIGNFESYDSYELSKYPKHGYINGVKLFYMRKLRLYVKTGLANDLNNLGMVLNKFKNATRNSYNLLHHYTLFSSSHSMSNQNTSKIGFEYSTEIYMLSQIPPDNSVLVKNLNPMTPEILGQLVFQYIFSFAELISYDELRNNFYFLGFLDCHVVISPKTITLQYPKTDRQIITNYVLLIPSTITYDIIKTKDKIKILSELVSSVGKDLLFPDVVGWKHSEKAKSFIRYYNNTFPVHIAYMRTNIEDSIKSLQHNTNIQTLGPEIPICDISPCALDLSYSSSGMLGEIHDYLDLYEYLRSGGELKDVRFNQRVAIGKLWGEIDKIEKEMTKFLLTVGSHDIKDFLEVKKDSDNPSRQKGDIMESFIDMVWNDLFSIKSVDWLLIYLKRILQCLEFLQGKDKNLKSPDTEVKINKLIGSFKEEVKRRKDYFVPLLKGIYENDFSRGKVRKRINKYRNMG